MTNKRKPLPVLAPWLVVDPVPRFGWFNLPLCVIAGCARPRQARGLCDPHFQSTRKRNLKRGNG